jgi:hypothetical protein
VPVLPSNEELVAIRLAKNDSITLFLLAKVREEGV